MQQGTVTEKMGRMVQPGESKYASSFTGQFAYSHNSGGYGSNGADGAAGGNAFVTVHEEDTDLLLPLIFDVKGGDGGISGQHGEPGDGGIGGRGGDGHVW